MKKGKKDKKLNSKKKMHDKKKSYDKRKLFFPIFLPLASALSVASVIVPMTCLSTKYAYLKQDSNQKEKFIAIDELAVFEFQKTNVKIKTSNLHCDWSYMPLSERKIKLEVLPITQSEEDQNVILVQIKANSLDDKLPEINDEILFNLNFTYFDNSTGETWNQSFPNNYIKVDK